MAGINMQTVKLFVKGLAMGAADVVPGVSGGTIAFITGIYSDLLKSINALKPSLFLTLLKGDWKRVWFEINGSFLLTLLLGISTSIISLAGIITYTLTHNPIPLWSFFLGLIFSSAVLIFRQIDKYNIVSILALLCGFIVAYFLAALPPMEGNQSLTYVFFSGAIAICAMILPGISGSFILLLLGMYSFILESLKSLQFSVIFTFIGGCLLGLVSFSRILSWLLEKHRNSTLAVLAGFMLGSLKKVWPWKACLTCDETTLAKKALLFQENLLPLDYEKITSNDPQILLAFACCFIGALLVLFIEKKRV